MNERAKAGVYWPGITKDIEAVRAACSSCNRIMPSQPRTPPVEPLIPSTPFEAVACDYFHFNGHYYFVAADRLSGWLEVQQIKVGTNEAGAKGLCKALRRLMIQVGVPMEISSDGGPEFSAGETEEFFKRWGIRHRISSVSFPSSNGRAELAVKTAKRLLMDNISPNGSLDNDAMVRALLIYRNTPDPGCKLSPAQILLGRPLRDTLPCISKEVMVFNNDEIHPQWKEAWKAKEEALKVRYVKTLENLGEHSRPLAVLQHGNHVMIQNQSGRFPKKWDKSGVIVEVRANDQYTVKVDGSGRLTLRNRRFLRKYDSHKLSPEWSGTYPQSGAAAGEARAYMPVQVDSPSRQPPLNIVRSRPPLQNEDAHEKSPDCSQPCTPTPSMPGCTPSSQQYAPTHVQHSMPDRSPSPQQYAPTQVCMPSPNSQRRAPMRMMSPPEPVEIVTPPAVLPGETIRSRRVRKQRVTFDASTGKDTTPQAVPDDI